jgi:hypothetical protein
MSTQRMVFSVILLLAALLVLKIMIVRNLKKRKNDDDRPPRLIERARFPSPAHREYEQPTGKQQRALSNFAHRRPSAPTFRKRTPTHRGK